MAAIGKDEPEGEDGEHHHGQDMGDTNAEGEPDDYDGKQYFYVWRTPQYVNAMLVPMAASSPLI